MSLRHFLGALNQGFDELFARQTAIRGRITSTEPPIQRADPSRADCSAISNGLLARFAKLERVFSLRIIRLDANLTRP